VPGEPLERVDRAVPEKQRVTVEVLDGHGELLGEQMDGLGRAVLGTGPVGRPDSDVDLLADLPPGLNLFGLGRAEADLEVIIGTVWS